VINHHFGYITKLTPKNKTIEGDKDIISYLVSQGDVMNNSSMDLAHG
jgi:hypothetical protein